MALKLVTCTIEETDHIATGKLAREAREKAGISVRELARRLDLSAPYVSDLELGRRSWTQGKVDLWNKNLKPGRPKK